MRNDLIVMIMGVGNKSTDYDDNDIETLSQLANLAWDIVQRKQAEELLKESEWRNRIVSELTTDYIFVVDVDPSGILKLRWASDNLFRITGRTIEDAATSDVWGNIIHPDDRVRFFDFINQILSTAEAGELECRIILQAWRRTMDTDICAAASRRGEQRNDHRWRDPGYHRAQAGRGSAARKPGVVLAVYASTLPLRLHLGSDSSKSRYYS